MLDAELFQKEVRINETLSIFVGSGRRLLNG
jgi:hypothetical protein